MSDLTEARERNKLRLANYRRELALARWRKNLYFLCGHPRIEDNIYYEKKQIRCLTCKREQSAQYQREQSTLKVRKVPIYKTPSCLLAEHWK